MNKKRDRIKKITNPMVLTLWRFGLMPIPSYVFAGELLRLWMRYE